MSFSVKFLTLNNKTSGKDKIFRTSQYACKLIWYILWKSKSNKEYVEKLKRIESAMSNTRKVLRLGKAHEMIEAALKSIHLDDDFLRYILTCGYLNQTCYLLMDNVLWLNSIGVLELNKSKSESMNKWSNKFWLCSTILYLARDLHDIIALIQNEENNRSKLEDKYTLNKSSGAYTSTGKRPKPKLYLRLLFLLRIIMMNKKNHPLLLDTIKNSFDIVLPLSSLKFINVSPGVQGFCGLVSSIISLLVAWDSQYALKP